MGRKNRGARDAGVSIWEALERLAPHELCERYKEIAEYLRHQVFVFGPGMPPPDPTYAEVRKLDFQLSKILTSRLESGELIASGIEDPVRNISNPRQDIAPDLWVFLRLDLIEGEASGRGLKLVDVRIRGLPPAGPLRSESEPRPDNESTIGDRTGRQRRGGPRTIMPLVEAEMVARAARGELLPTLAAESRFLEKWAKAHHPEFARPPRAKSIGEALRSIYKELKEGGDSGN